MSPLIQALRLLALFPCLSLARLYHVADGARPGLAYEGSFISWYEGGWARVLSGSRTLRINMRGVFTYPEGVRNLEALGWAKAPCNVTFDALCRADVGGVFPVFSVLQPGDRGKLPVHWRSLSCGDSSSKRVVSDGQYDISACDVLDEGLDVVYSDGMLYFRKTSLEEWAYWGLILMGIVLVRGLSYNLGTVVSEGGKPVSQVPVFVSAGAASLFVMVGGSRAYVTWADVAMHWVTIAYVYAYLGFHVMSRYILHLDASPVFNMIVGSLLMIATRLYGGAQSPYSLVLAGAIGIRFWQKLGADRQRITLLLDASYLSLLVALLSDWDMMWLVGTAGVSYVVSVSIAPP